MTLRRIVFSLSLVLAVGLAAVLGPGVASAAPWRATAKSADMLQQAAQLQPDAPIPRDVLPSPPDPTSPNDLLKGLGISGYADPLSAQPGDTVKFHVSSESPTFHSTIVRVIHGDADPRGPGIKEEVVSTPVNKDYPGQHHDLPVGSHVTVPDNPALQLTSSFTITAWVAPTTIPGSGLNPLAFHRSPAGTPRPQGILTKFSESTGTGYGLFIDQDGSLALWLGSSRGRVEKIRTGVPMHPWDPTLPGVYAGTDILGPPSVFPQETNSRWYYVAGSFDAQAGTVSLFQEPLAPPPDFTADLPDPTRVIVQRSTSIQALGQNQVAALMAAFWTKSNQVGGFYNGKIDNPRLYDRALTPAEIAAIRKGASVGGALASWDFSKQMSTTQVVDVSPRHLNGSTVNLPGRALTGHNWARQEMDWTKAPSQWSAMWFQEDALGDSRWPVSFEFKVPDDLRSGFYAAKLETATHEYHVSFWVRPKPGRPTASIAFLVPTFSYLAYGMTGTSQFSLFALSHYSRHDDGGGVFYSSRLRPLSNMRSMATGPASDPRKEGVPWQYEADTHIVDWLESNGFKADYITDQDLQREGTKLLAPYKAVLTGSHPEYYSAQMLDSVQKYLDNGGRLMYLGGNGFYWIDVPDPTGTFLEMRRRDGTETWHGAPGESYHSLTGEFGGLWVFRGRPPQELVGTGFTAQGFGSPLGTGSYSRPYTRDPDSFDPRAAFVFEGVGANEQIGNFPSLQNPGGAAGEELDRFEYGWNTPATTLVLATASGFDDRYLFVVEEVHIANDLQGGSVNPLVRADMTLSFYPRGGAVFSVSSISYSGSLFFNNFDNNVSRITGNVLRTFMSRAPLPGAPVGD